MKGAMLRMPSADCRLEKQLRKLLVVLLLAESRAYCCLQFANVDHSFLANCSERVVCLPRKTNDFPSEQLASWLRKHPGARLYF
jgi:hypothetical protein